MTSSIAAGERKWASARRGGMTVLGKVAVPKPINLPSQRLENHGLDPNVEIVPKGTHSWGSRSSFSASNAWGSSTLSLNTDGGSTSPSHLSGRPSSGGSGTQPSTGSSDRTQEPFANAWGSHSRPSSASGALTSNQSSLVSLRPRSAETRPGSSQLSRFAEPLSDNSVAWGATGTTEKSALLSSKNDGFSLTSGDFPTLGSEKENSGSTDSQEHGSNGRPGSSSGMVTGKEGPGNSVGDISVNANEKVGNADSWRRENPMYSEDGARPSVEKWQAEPQLYPNSSIPPQRYDAWHGPPVNNHPGGVWYRQPPGGPPFVPPVGPGGFPMEPFPYYRPQIPPATLANQQSVPPLRTGPAGPHPKNGDMYRPPMHDAYIRPGMPLRPGFYPGPVPYEVYYGPPMGYCNTSERDIPFTGITMGPPAAYNRYSGQTSPDLIHPHGRSSGCGPGSKSVISEQAESGHPQDARGPYKVLMKQHDGWEGKGEQKWDESMATNSDLGKRDYPSKSSWENGWRADHKKDKEIDTRRMAQAEEALDKVNNQGGIPLNAKVSERIGNFKSSDDSSVKKFEIAASVLPEVSTAPRDPSLLQKIEGLNAKVRASDGRTEAKSISNRQEQKNELQACNARVSYSSNEAVMGLESLERTHTSDLINTASHEVYLSAGDRHLESTTPRRPTHGIYGRADHRSKGRSSAQEADGWWRRSHVTKTSRGVLASDFEASCAVQGQTHNTEITEKYGFFPQQNDDGESVPPVTASSDSHAQRAKMKESAEQRHKRREKEEEERTRDLKAKALAKLKELNRRTQAEGSMAKLEATPIGALEDKQEELSSPAQPTIVAGKSKEACSAVVSNTNAVAHDGEGSVITRLDKSTSLNTESQLQIAKTFHKEPVLLDQLELLQQEPLELDVDNADSSNPNSTPRVNGISAFRQKQKGYRQKQNNSLESYSTERPIIFPIAEGLEEHANVAANVPLSIESVGKEIPLNSELSSPVNSSVTVEFSAHQRRKGKSGKNKLPVVEALPTVVSLSLASKDTVALEILTESNKSKTSEPMWDPTSAQSGTNSKNASQSSEQHLSLSNEETQIRINNQWKSQHSRRLPRNSQANKLVEKFHSGDAVVWAPVRSQNKTEISDEGSPNSAVETVGPSIKSDHQVQNNPRNKRAEMERYIPKPVAKEMAQQGSGHQVVAPPVSQITSDPSGRTQSGSLGTESTQSSVTSVGKAVSTVESRNGDGRHNKSIQEHESWRQRSSGESIDSSLCRNTQKMIEHHQSLKMYARSVKEQSKYSDEWNASNGWNVPEDSGTAVIVPVVKDQGVTARGKWQPYKGHKSAGHNCDSDEKKISSGDTEKIQSSVNETCQAEVLATSKENRAARELLTTHWQPKSHPFSGTNWQGSRPYGIQNVSDEVGRANKPTFQAAMSVPLKAEKETAVVRDERPQHDQSLPDKSKSKQVLSVEYLEAKKEIKMDTHKGLPRNPVEPSPLNMDFQHECISSGFRKSGNQNSRFEQDSQCDWNGSGRDNKQHNATVNRERQKRNSHFGRQPVDRNSTTRANNFEPPKDVSHDFSPRFRERGQSHLRRGGVSFHGRQSGNV
uniref:BAT2 N-terminal domain-containing protein n=1 Tax=Rhizophora mucronata TaxID=61149 RepID=A0A2P2M0Y9_RHIMU